MTEIPRPRTPAEPEPACGGSPDDTLILQYQLINARDYEGAYALFAQIDKALISFDEYNAFFEQNAPTRLPTTCSTHSVEVATYSAIVDVAFTVSDGDGSSRAVR